jgi:hypothetical protein
MLSEGLGSSFLHEVGFRKGLGLSLSPKRLKRYKAVGLTTGILMCEDEIR